LARCGSLASSSARRFWLVWSLLHSQAPCGIAWAKPISDFVFWPAEAGAARGV
tara:strand:+ start:426 stop:584 length:159 start_codon:yes stop_codon:yes gene_type:complete